MRNFWVHTKKRTTVMISFKEAAVTAVEQAVNSLQSKPRGTSEGCGQVVSVSAYFLGSKPGMGGVQLHQRRSSGGGGRSSVESACARRSGGKDFTAKF